MRRSLGAFLRARTHRSEGGAAAVAALALRAAALLRGGVRPGQLWGTIADTSGTRGPSARRGQTTAGTGSAELRSAGHRSAGHRLAAPRSAGVGSAELGALARGIAALVAAGTPVDHALAAQPDPPWRVLAAAWRLAEQSGAPLAPALERIGTACAELARLEERRSVLLAGPRATVRLVLALPVLAFGLGAALGFDPFAVLLTGPGAALLCGGSALMGAGIAWTRALHRQAERADTVAGLECELLWVALGGGAAPAQARLRTADAVDALAAEWVPLERFCRGELLDTTLATAAGTGAALGPLLLAEAGAARLRAEAQLERDAERFGVRILLPLGCCVLPAFVATGVAPVVLSMLGGL